MDIQEALERYLKDKIETKKADLKGNCLPVSKPSVMKYPV